MNIFDIPIISYHKISLQKEFGVTTISPQTFKNQLELLIENGYETVTFKQLDSNQILPQKPIIISFDDTYKSVYDNAYPVMKKLNFKGVLFVISDYIGKKNLWEAYPIQRNFYHANEDEINELIINGFELGSHSKSHNYLPYLSNEIISNELTESKHFLESTFKTEIITCCYPYGGYNRQVIKIAQTKGYRFGMGNLRYTSRAAEKPLCLQRRSVYSNDSLSTFYNKVVSKSKIKINFISEWLIQKGAYAGIIKKNLFNI
jgi:peptidoglycan/xylan/chitin deacetylase (PgdA/CDA1 family)